MTAIPNHSINYFAPLASGASCSVGQVMIPESTAAAYYVVATTANRGTRGSEGVAISAWGGASGTVGQVKLQQDGILPASISGLSTNYGSRTLVRCSSTGSIERVASYSAGDDIIGYAESDGRVHLHFGLPWAAIAAAGGVPAGSNKQYQYNNSGAFGATTWTWEGSGQSRAPAESWQSVVRNSGSDPQVAWAHTYDATYGEVMLYGSDWNGTAASMPDHSYFWALKGLSVGLGTGASALAGYSVFSPGSVIASASPLATISGVSAWPSFGIRPDTTQLDDNYFGLGVGVFRLPYATTLATDGQPSAVIVSVHSDGNAHYIQPNDRIVNLWDGPQKTVSASGTISDQSTLDANNRPVRVIRFTANSAVTLNSLDNGREGRVVWLVRLPSGESGGSLTITANSGGTAANRIVTDDGYDFTMSGGVVAVVYDTTTARWRLASRSYRSLGEAGEDTTIRGANILGYVDSGGTIDVAFNSSREWLVEAGVQFGIGPPLKGIESRSMALRMGSASITFVMANYTLGASEIACPFLSLGGLTGGGRDLICPDVAGSTFNIKNDTADTITVKKSGGTGFTIASGSTAWAFHNGSDYEAR